MYICIIIYNNLDLGSKEVTSFFCFWNSPLTSGLGFTNGVLKGPHDQRVCGFAVCRSYTHTHAQSIQSGLAVASWVTFNKGAVTTINMGALSCRGARLAIVHGAHLQVGWLTLTAAVATILRSGMRWTLSPWWLSCILHLCV